MTRHRFALPLALMLVAASPLPLLAGEAPGGEAAPQVPAGEPAASPEVAIPAWDTLDLPIPEGPGEGVAGVPEAAPGPSAADPARKAARAWREEGVEPPVLHAAAAVAFPYGHSLPALTCAPLRACDIALQAGETILGVALGDAERWITSPLSEGPAGGATPHVVVKPTGWGLATNLIVSTDRRVYHLELSSPERGPAGSYDAAVGFYYPDELVSTWARAGERGKAERARREAAEVASLAAPDPTALNFDYRLETSGKRPFAWTPEVVFDDGSHTYLRFPEDPGSGTPILLVETAGGPALVNGRWRGRWYVADLVFARGELVVGSGRVRQSIAVVNRRRQG